MALYGNTIYVHTADQRIIIVLYQGDAVHRVLVCGLSSHVSLHVQGQVVAPGEGPLTQVTLERPVSRVLPEVTCELIGASELPAAALPAAVVWFLSCKHKKTAMSDVTV